ncbi:hypothetical protein EMIHUDRAFT_354485 [Emiliania huxleyi CCMP1516]|uniref:Uncharacterized protein n=2 Tax=Emiliania huxleyi TaxID=2903 RepID=A0A0D3JMG0_EMIH1|nr:hypothetical protein EMIHUDRAFT_354485 [Emiliania huxleyi CCMP1516]EOD24695.1 hypothetical protein EMIHUDRAFT_354485 [Emiliania huxleyi CCMP1516]|eukprot:XP_005777124.1 hypothetical protein EMIHUDRAFT_354485 [Emiliania huxleyi CCMP1516]
MFRKVTWPLGRHRHRVLGKGGGAAEGGKYMVGHAIEMLRLQGFDGARPDREPHEILIVGDRFDTDIRAGIALAGGGPSDSVLRLIARVADLLPPEWRGGALDRPLARPWVHRNASMDDFSASPPSLATIASSRDSSCADDAAPSGNLLGRAGAVRGEKSLREWTLSRGDLVHAASMRLGAHEPLIGPLRAFFEAKAPPRRRNCRTAEHAATGTIAAEDVMVALKELGLSRGLPDEAGIPLRGGRGDPAPPRVSFRDFVAEVTRVFSLEATEWSLPQAAASPPGGAAGRRRKSCEQARILYGLRDDDAPKAAQPLSAPGPCRVRSGRARSSSDVLGL